MYRIFCFLDGTAPYKNTYRIYWIYDDVIVRAYDEYLPTDKSITRDVFKYATKEALDADRINISIEWFYYRAANN